MRRTTSSVLAAAIAMPLSLSAPARASTIDIESLAASLDEAASLRADALVAGKIASSFTLLAGSQSNALALANALRGGTRATLSYAESTASAGTPAMRSATYEPPTGTMGWGHVKIALALAQDCLARAGIARPTAAELLASLDGGDVTVKGADGSEVTTGLQGVLRMRSAGMSWGQISRATGTKLGPVASGLKYTQGKIVALPASSR